MDSGNSGSLQSSSGGDANTVTGVSAADEVYNSRQESLFLNPSIHFNHLPPPQSSSNFFDPTSFSQPINQNPNPTPNSMYNLESLWTRNTNPNPNPNSNQNPIYNLDTHQDPIYDHNLNPNPVSDNINTNTGPEKGKNPKKRTRASRRAPTTVLTTDTTNFRQMVQEFTGIPAPPFSTATSSSFPRRLDLSPVQRIQLQPQPSYLNSVNATSSTFHLPPQEIQGFTKHPLNLSNFSNLTNAQNQMFSFHSGSQTNVSQRENQRSQPLSESSKRWRGENEHLMNFEGRISNSNNNNNQNVGVSLRSDGEQLQQGNEDSWICPSD